MLAAFILSCRDQTFTHFDCINSIYWMKMSFIEEKIYKWVMLSPILMMLYVNFQPKNIRTMMLCRWQNFTERSSCKFDECNCQEKPWRIGALWHSILQISSRVVSSTTRLCTVETRTSSPCQKECCHYRLRSAPLLVHLPVTSQSHATLSCKKQLLIYSMDRLAHAVKVYDKKPQPHVWI